MPGYRLYFVGPEGHFEGVEAFISRDDAAAVVTGALHPDPRAKELWRLGDRIKSYPASPEAGRAVSARARGFRGRTGIDGRRGA